MSNIIAFPEWYWSIASLFTVSWNISNKNTMQANKKYDRGDRNLSIDIIGICAELVAGSFMSRFAHEYYTAPILSKHPLGTADIIIFRDGIVPIRFDIKGFILSNSRSDFQVNIEAHHKKPVDYYLFIGFNGMYSTSAQLWKVPYGDVGGWEVKQGINGADYYSAPIEKYEQLTKGVYIK